ncbi:MAG: TetR/AcrR family transcriptional regulator [Gammaproteobacteria bacterium]|uniref:TetR/AcrR family transcriptional regulator n=1 Tax=Pseudomaricurvus alcaniphilus TaxID=1166482 RepID=UPI00140E4E71|nr:TetR/AcrR family transcriptional regulator [Pseudomaricurvus alcaniphilus]MBR9909217.1 TetR/AcrR family transcriptional regulator [Gammaproteobacteria bacterium]NHN38221.1 TetR/AcrR family transcriptional regulator [Pseudomaricurvus alcaniphilus]
MTKKVQQTKSSSKVETMQRILDAARAEFADKGLDKAHIQSIAEAAGVTKQLIYHYYLSKDNLFACVLDESSYHAMTELAQLDLEHLPPREAMRSMLYQMFDQFKQDPALASLATEGIRYHDNHDTPRNRVLDMGPLLTVKMTDIIQRGVDEGLFHDRMPPNYVFATAALMISGTFTSRYLISAVGGFDPTDNEAPLSWKTYIADLILNALEKH